MVAYRRKKPYLCVPGWRPLRGPFFFPSSLPPCFGVFPLANLPGLHILTELSHLTHDPPPYTDHPDTSTGNHVADRLRVHFEEISDNRDGLEFLFCTPFAVSLVRLSDLCDDVQSELAKVLGADLVDDFVPPPSLRPVGFRVASQK